MNPIDYSQLPLRDIHLPDPISWWPLAYGWWILIGIVVAAGLIGWFFYRQRYRQRAAIRGLKAVAAALAEGSPPGVCVQRISMILRRFAMSVGESRSIAGLIGDEWLRFLDHRWGRDEFLDGVGRILIFGPYAPPGRVTAADAGRLNELCLDWVRAQRPPEK